MPSDASKANGTYAVLAASAVAATYAGTHAYQSRIQRKYGDGIDLKNQTVEIDPVEHIRRCTFYKDVDLYSYYKTIFPNVQTLGDVFYSGYTLSQNGPCIAEVDLANETGPLSWIPYATALERIRQVGSHLWTNARLTPMKSVVAIISTNRPEYTFAEYGCYVYGFTVLALYTSYDPSTIMSLLEKTQTEVLVVDNLKRIESYRSQLLNLSFLKEILVMDEVTTMENEKIKSMPVVFQTMAQCTIRPKPQIDPDSVATFILTSGTTGEPKMAMLTHTNILSTVIASIGTEIDAKAPIGLRNRHCSFLPLAHLMERLILAHSFLQGVQVAYCPAPEELFAYYAVVKPTNVYMVPRILNKVYDLVMAQVGSSRIKRFLLSQALHSDQPTFFSRLVFRKVKKLFGGEVNYLVTGSAPIASEVLHFFRIALDAPIVEGYAQSESAGGGTHTHLTDTSCGTVGTPLSAVEIKLSDVPGTSYRSDRNQGEICLRGPTIFKGYYGDEAKTRETIDEGGWLHTGDVGEWTSTGALRIIDRTKHIFKLNQGEYIAPERLQDVYVRSRWVQQIFIDGISTESTVVAIVIPDREYVEENYRATDGKRSFEDCCQDPKLKEVILTDLRRLAKENKFKFYETVSNIYLHPEPFSQQNGFVTLTQKTRRTAVRQHFQAIIQSLYQPADRISKPNNVEQQSKL